MASLPVIAEDPGRVLVDATDLVLQDWRDVTGRSPTRAMGPTRWSRTGRTCTRRHAGFPRNTELEAALTFEAQDRPGPIVSRLAPDGRSFTVRQRITLAELPDDGYRPRGSIPA